MNRDGGAGQAPRSQSKEELVKGEEKGLEEEGNWKLTFNGCTVSILEDGKFWR